MSVLLAIAIAMLMASLRKVPHPKGSNDNVGLLLSKDFVADMEAGRLTSDTDEAKRALEIANATSYWTSVRKRVMDRIFVDVDNPHGEDAMVSMPEIIAHGTVTRRTVESLMVTMCSTKKWRVGTELKTRVQCPDGWRIVGADFDGQELQIASIYADAWEGGFVGASPMAYTILSGSKEQGTDAHTALAKAVDIDRDTAKGVGFAMLYGAGVRTIGNTIKKSQKDRSAPPSSGLTQLERYLLRRARKIPMASTKEVPTVDATITWRRSLLEPECPPFPVLEPKYLRHLDPRLSDLISIREELIGQYNQAALKCWQSFLQPPTGLLEDSKSRLNSSYLSTMKRGSWYPKSTQNTSLLSFKWLTCTHGHDFKQLVACQTYRSRVLSSVALLLMIVCVSLPTSAR